MSRALDPSVERELQYGNHKLSFERVSVVLEGFYATYLEIEILPKSHVVDQDTYVLQDETYVGVPKLRLVQAFLYALQILNGVVHHNRDICDEEVQRATAIILLMDSEHLTAANIRKRVLRRGVTSDGIRMEKLDREVFLVNSLLRSRLHRHTKSPVLWNHKRWLLRQTNRIESPLHLLHEFEQVIYVAAERHPRNYYAWTYARDVIAMECALSHQRASLVVDTILPTVTIWCRLHHHDVSGWSFLLHLLELFPEKAEGVLNETLSLVEKFQWRNESVWHFLRNLMLMPIVRTKRHRMLEVWTQLRQDVKSNATLDAAILDAAAAWGDFR